MTDARKPDARKARGSTNREKEARPVSWKPPSSLDAPPARPGYVNRWVRVSMAGQDDTKNASARLREGFEPVRKETHPDFEAPVISEGKYEGVFGVGGLVLMEIPEEIVAARKDYFQKQTAGQMQSVKENLMRENAHDTMRIRMERSSQVSKFGGDR